MTRVEWSSPVSLIEPFHVPPLDGGIGDHDHSDSETDTAIPDDDDDVASLASQLTVSIFAAIKPLVAHSCSHGLPLFRCFRV